MMIDISRYIPRTEDIKKINQLIQIITSNKCIAFIGAGVSVNKGYRPWKNLIYDQTINGNLSGLLEYGGINEQEVAQLNYAQIMDYCQDKMNDRNFTDFLINEYSRKAIEISDNHSLISKINFTHIITTNFDPCLYDNIEGNDKPILVVHPGNSLILQSNRSLYHIHGRAFLIDNEEKDKLNILIKKLIFGERSFKKYYIDNLEIKSFLYSIFKSYKVLFLGYSMEDQIFNKTMEGILAARLDFLNDCAEMHSMPLPDNNIGFMFLEYPLKQIKELRNSNLETNEKETLKNQISLFTEKENKLKSMGIHVIGFDRIDENFSGLTTILQYLKNNAAKIGLLKPSESLDASLTASITGSI